MCRIVIVMTALRYRYRATTLYEAALMREWRSSRPWIQTCSLTTANIVETTTTPVFAGWTCLRMVGTATSTLKARRALTPKRARPTRSRRTRTISLDAAFDARRTFSANHAHGSAPPIVQLYLQDGNEHLWPMALHGRAMSAKTSAGSGRN